MSINPESATILGQRNDMGRWKWIEERHGQNYFICFVCSFLLFCVLKQNGRGVSSISAFGLIQYKVTLVMHPSHYIMSTYLFTTCAEESQEHKSIHADKYYT